MKARKKLDIKRMRRKARVGARITGTAERPRLVVNRTNRYLYAQLIDDAKGHTLASISTSHVGASGSTKSAATKVTKGVQAFTAGEALAAKAVAKGVKTAVFDRRSSKFHGRVKQFAEGAKKGGLKI